MTHDTYSYSAFFIELTVYAKIFEKEAKEGNECTIPLEIPKHILSNYDIAIISIN